MSYKVCNLCKEVFRRISPDEHQIDFCKDCLYSVGRYNISNCEIDEDEQESDDNLELKTRGEYIHLCSNYATKEVFTKNFMSSTFIQNPSKRFIGCEIEISGLKKPIRRDIMCDKAKVYMAYNNAKLFDIGALPVYDGSLETTGFEIVTFPSNGDAFLNQIKQITDLINSQKGFVSSECGMHIHIDLRDYEEKDMFNFLKVYSFIEKAIYASLAEPRRENSFCRPMADNYIFRDMFDSKRSKKVCRQIAYGSEVFTDNNLKISRQEKKPTGRYKGVNVSSFYHQKTIELRMFGGTTDYNKIKNWCLFWANFASKVKNLLTNNNEIFKFLKSKSNNLNEYSSMNLNKIANGWSTAHSIEFLMKMCSSDEQRTWFINRIDKYTYHEGYIQKNIPIVPVYS